MSERAAYSRVYWSIIDDDKFVTVYDDDRHLATWLRLLLAADQSWPASANLHVGVRKASVAALCAVGLVDVTGSRYRVRGLDAERNRRKEWATTRGPSGDRPVPERSPSGIQTQGLSLDKPSQDETSLDEPTREDLVNDYYRLTNRFPSPKVTPWLERLSAEFGYDAASRKLAEQFAVDSSPQTLLGRVEAELKVDQHNAAKSAEVAAKERLEAFARERAITPEKAAENRKRITEIQKQWLGKEAS